LIVRIIEIIEEKKKNTSNLKSFETLKKVLPDMDINSVNTRVQPGKTDLVFFVGGYTAAEVAALKALQATTGRLFVVAGTSKINGSGFIKHL